ncbi:MAG: hypothetical protein US31_C0011G0027 [Berkelbacteria bacterium GW2011_GWA1_36_9]|uniref:GlxA-like beta barrel domain-containing protein n=1 Tax=Berkelbacteria bacterium GW2011_GWA1_36_9 TaxID=1618331 RepID=A0A0G0FW03_9BACT|nr:MAG: hypothetical protein US31_C0011G0027 [Berkelbacteria bacterium GW2011_GWA1_36_9]
MDEILYLEPDEEITSVIDKIKHSKVARLGLVVPREATLLQSVVNLRLLVKEAANLGKEIALITSDKIGRNLASKVGLPVFESVKNQQPIFQPPPPIINQQEVIEIDDTPNVPKEEIKPRGFSVHHFQEKEKELPQQTRVKVAVPWQPQKTPKEHDLKNIKKIIWPMITLVIILILIGAFLVLPKVQVKLKVQAENFEKTTDAQVSGTEATSLESKTFLGQLIDLNQEKEEKFTTTGKKNLGGKASGTITIYNNLDNSNHNFSAGAKLSSSSKTFVFKSNVTVPGAGVQSGRAVPGTANVEIEAENAGEEYNVKAGRFTIVGLPSGNQEFIYGQSSKDLTGGFSKVAQVVSQDDYDKAKNKLTTELTDSLKKELQDKAGGLEVLENAIQIETASETSSAKVDSEAQDFTLKIKMRLREMVFERSGFDKFIISLLEKQIPSTQMISLGANDTISPQVKEKKYDSNLLTFDVRVSAKTSAKIDTEQVKNNLQGKSKQDATNYLNGLEGLSGFDFIYSPSWWPIKRIPSFARNLTVTLDYLEPILAPQPSPSPSPSPLPEATK